MQLPLQCFAEIVESLRHSARESVAAEQRRSTRMAVQARVAVFPGDNITQQSRNYSALTRDVSPMGIGLIQSTAAPQGSHLVVVLPRRRQEPAAIMCTVRHCRLLADGLHMIGAEFTDLLQMPVPQQPQV